MARPLWTAYIRVCWELHSMRPLRLAVYPSLHFVSKIQGTRRHQSNSFLRSGLSSGTPRCSGPKGTEGASPLIPTGLFSSTAGPARLGTPLFYEASWDPPRRHPIPGKPKPDFACPRCGKPCYSSWPLHPHRRHKRPKEDEEGVNIRTPAGVPISYKISGKAGVPRKTKLTFGKW